MSEPPVPIPRTVVGVRPWLPWPLSRWRWWTEPVPAERLAALRIGLALVLLCDILLTYLPHRRDFFGGDSLGSPPVFAYRFQPEWDWRTLGDDLARGEPFAHLFQMRWRWSLLRGVEDPRVLTAALGLWTAATLGLALGAATRLSAAAVWVLSTSVANVNSAIDNAGDLVRGIVLFYLVLCPCGAAWSIDSWRKRRRGRGIGPVYVYPWALRLLFVQMVLIYWCNGVFKLMGSDWWAGHSLYYVLADLRLTRWSYAQLPVPYLLTRLLTWMVLAWEATFPLLVLWRRTRVVALAFGVLFHLGIGLTLELGFFTPYMLTLYLPLLPWERWRRGRVA